MTDWYRARAKLCICAIGCSQPGLTTLSEIDMPSRFLRQSAGLFLGGRISTGHMVRGQMVPSWPANTRRRPNVALMLGRRRRRWPVIKTTLGRRLVFCRWQNYGEGGFLDLVQGQIAPDLLVSLDGLGDVSEGRAGRRWYNVVPASKTLAPRCTNAEREIPHPDNTRALPITRVECVGGWGCSRVTRPIMLSRPINEDCNVGSPRYSFHSWSPWRAL